MKKIGKFILEKPLIMILFLLLFYFFIAYCDCRIYQVYLDNLKNGLNISVYNSFYDKTISFIFKSMSYIVVPAISSYLVYGLYDEKKGDKNGFWILIIAYLGISLFFILLSVLMSYPGIETIAKSFTIPIVVSGIAYIYKK